MNDPFGTGMKRPASPRRALRAGLLAACTLAGATCAALAQDAAPLPVQSVVVEGTRDPSSWLRAESPHFVAWTDTSDGDARRLLDQLERLDALLRLYTAPIRKADAGAAQKLTLYYLNGTSGFKRFAPDAPAFAIGTFSSCAAGVLGIGVQVAPLAALADADLAKRPLDAGLSYLFEGYARHFLYRHTDVRAPAAMIEGFAKYFSAVRFSDTQMVIGRTPTGVGRYFALLDEGHPYLLDYADVFARTYAPVADIDVDARARTRQLEFEARAWAMAHYMLSSDERRARLPAFLDAVHLGRPPAQAFQHSYGIAPDDLANAMWRYRLTAKTLQVAQPPMAPLPIATRVLPRSAGQFVQAEALRAACPATPEGQALLRRVSEQAASMDEGASARAGIARIQVEWGDAAAVARVLPVLRKAAARDPEDADAAYWLGRAELRLAAQEPEHLAPARTELERAGTLRPAASDIALARLQAALASGAEPARTALDGVLAAWRGARDNNALARQATLAYAWTGDPANADHLLQVLSNDSRDADSQAWAVQWRARLEKGVAPTALFGEMRRLGQAGPAVREWTIDQDTVARDTEYRKSLQDAMRAGAFQSTSDGSPSPSPSPSPAPSPVRER